MNNKWYKFLLTEGEDVKIDPETVMTSEEEKQKFINTWKTNKHFRDRLFKDIIELEIDNVFKSLPRDKQIEIYKIIKPSYGPNQSFGQHGYVSDIAEEFKINFSNRTAVRNLNETFVYYLLKKYFKSMTEEEFDQSFGNQKNLPLDWIKSYHLLYSNFDKHTPSIPKISYVPRPEMSENKKHNLEILNQYYDIPEEQIRSEGILDEIKIKNHIGSGYYGNVFSTEDGRAIKIFTDGVNMQQDLKRMQKVSGDLFSMKGAIEDMPYFDFGKIGNSSFRYVIMPEIVPLTKAPFYKLSEIFEAAANVNKTVTRELKYIFKSAPSYKKYKDLFIVRLEQMSDYRPYNFDEEYNKYAETIDKIAQAGYRAYKKFKGSDLHSGNIGYLRQKPDTFFYFDM